MRERTHERTTTDAATMIRHLAHEAAPPTREHCLTKAYGLLAQLGGHPPAVDAARAWMELARWCPPSARVDDWAWQDPDVVVASFTGANR